MANRVVITGRMTADPEMRCTPDNTPVITFSIAVPRKYKKDVTDFLDVVAWRKEAEFVGQYFSKGKWIEVDGSIQTRTYTDKSGNKRKAIEIVADNVSFVGDKPKDEGDAASDGAGYVPSQPQSPPPPAAPPGFDPFRNAAPPAAPPPVDPGQFPGAPSFYGGYQSDEVDEDGDLRF